MIGLSNGRLRSLNGDSKEQGSAHKGGKHLSNILFLLLVRQGLLFWGFRLGGLAGFLIFLLLDHGADAVSHLV